MARAGPTRFRTEPDTGVSMQIRRFREEDRAGIDSLNARLAAAGIADRVYPESETVATEALGDPLTQELYVAVDGENVRGGVWLHEHDFAVRGRTVRAGWFKYPVSESLIDRAYSGIPGAMLFALVRRQPNLMALGMGGPGGPLARLLSRIGWSTVLVPFYIAPVHPFPILTTLPRIRRRRAISIGASVVAYTGLPSVVGAAINGARSLRTSVAGRGATLTPVSEFGDWTTDLWLKLRDGYGFIARRDAPMLNRMYPQDFPGLTRLRFKRAGRDIGWSCTTLSGADPGSSAHEFGSLRVGMLVDALGDARDAATILGMSTRYLIRSGADLIVTNQIAPSWRSVLRGLGFVSAPSNFLFACSKSVAALFDADGSEDRTLFLNRGDCDGPPRW